MKWNRSHWLLTATLFASALAARADLARWIQDIAAPSPLQAVFFRAMPLPSGPVEVRRPPQETREALSKMIGASPSQADLYSLRAQEDEMQLDFTAAEADWKKYVELAADKVRANLDLAEFYHRRVKPREEIAALEIVGQSPTPAAEKFKPETEQQSWRAYERILSLIQESKLPADLSSREYAAWIARYPSEPSVLQQSLTDLIQNKQWAEAEKRIAEYRRVFPHDDVFPIVAQANLAESRGSINAALSLYDRAFQPLWPPELINGYFQLLAKTHELRHFVDVARTRLQANPGDIAQVARLFYYYQRPPQPNAAGSLRVLYEYRTRKDANKAPWTADELWTLGHLFQIARNYDEAARSYYELYKQPGVNNQERSLTALAALLLTVPDQPIRFGSGDLSFYRDIATMDDSPGFLNGILSLLFNSTSPGMQYDTENQASTAYFHRAAAAELIARLDQRFPTSSERPALHARLIQAYITYGDDGGVIRTARQFLSAFPNAAERTDVALSLAEAYARKNQTKQEFAVYEDLLKELAARSDHVPLGENAVIPPRSEQPATEATQHPGARSAEYARVLDHYVSRLVALKQTRGALSLYRREIDRNPNDPGLYERLAGFLEQNKMGADLEQTYRKAMAQFPDGTWSHKLARWYLRTKQTAQFDALTREVVRIFSGTGLETYLNEAERGQPIAPVLYRQVNLYAHQRFPYDMLFVRNLLQAYSAKGTADPVARDLLLRTYWYYAPDLRDQFFEQLSRSGKLRTQLAALGKPDPVTNPAAARFAAEAQGWMSHFEAAAPLYRAAAAAYPGEVPLQTNGASLYRSLATYDPPGNLARTGIAVKLQETAASADPRNTQLLATVGDIYADKDLLQRAKPFWNRMAAVIPGDPNNYIAAATVFWDYYQFDDALRLIAEARRETGNPNLYSYEAGAIFENRREYGRAVDEYAKGALNGENPQSRSRLVQLSKRPQLNNLIDGITTRAAGTPSAPREAVELRTEVLFAQNRPQEVNRFLLALTSITPNFDVLQFVDEMGATHGWPEVQEQAKLRRIGLTSDPVERLQAQIELVHFYEGRGEATNAGRLIADLYRRQPLILGIVRASVDYYWRNKQPARAIDVLAEAAAKAGSDYRNPLLLEAARKATDSGDYNRARTLLGPLLQASPFQSEYVAAMADTYARQGDDNGLRAFYQERLKAVQQSSLPASEKVERSAALRRGLIPVFTRQNDYSNAVDQYIEILNRYPEDAGLVGEAAAYARQHGRSAQLLGYYQKTEAQSPKDFRWPMVEARIQLHLEDFPAAVSAYRRAADLRPDRTDFYQERATLEVRLLRFDDAVQTYSKLYDLSYHNTAWMEAIAEVRARQGQTDAAVKALDKAFVAGRTGKPDAYFSVAKRLESWNMLDPARSYAQKGVDLSTGNLLSDYPEGARIYVRILVRQRQYDAAYQKLAALSAGKPVPPDQLSTMGAVVAEFYGPEEKLAFAAFVGTRLEIFLPAIQSAGLQDLLAKAYANDPDKLANIQIARLQFAELAARQEALWKASLATTQPQDPLLDQAAANYRLAGNTTDELRALGLLASRASLSGPLLQRYSQLVAQSPQRLEAAAGAGSDDVRNAIANYAILYGTQDEALRAIAARGRGMTPLWNRAYTALTGLYLASNMPQIAIAFQEALGTGTIGERLGKPVDRDAQFAGDLWFYYGSRYGEYLGITKQGDPEDYLPAGIEARPGSSQAYFELAEYYRSSAQPDLAVAEYRHALELDSGRSDVHERLAVMAWREGKRAEATAEFRAALHALSLQQDQARIPPNFWTELELTLRDMGRSKLFDALKADADRVLRTYVHRNSAYRAESLLEAAMFATGDPSQGVAWIVDLAGAAPEPAVFLSAIVNANWIPKPQRPVVYQALIANARKPEMEQELRQYQINYALYLVEHKRPAEVRAVLADLPQEARNQRQPAVISIEVQSAAQTKELSALLARYGTSPGLDSKIEDIRAAATELEKSGNHAAAREVLEFVYTRQIEGGQTLTPGIFLGLAEIRLEQGKTSDALVLLRRMTMILGAPFDNLMDAGNLLVRMGHPNEATAFFEQRVKGVPWDFEARVALANVQKSVEAMQTITASNAAPYQNRVAAARALGQWKAGPVSSGSTELDLLTAPPIAPAAAEKPYFYYARADAAVQTRDALTKLRLLRGAIAIQPGSSDPLRFDLILAALSAKQWQTAVSASTGLPQADNGPLARGLAQAHEQLCDLPKAEELYRLAGAEADRLRIQAAIERQQINNRRRPVVGPNLEQDHPVRPRLVASNGGPR